MTVNRYQINKSNFIVEIMDDGIPMHYSTIVNRLNEQHKEIQQLKIIKNQYKGQRDYLLWAMERLLPKKVFEEQKGYLQEVED